jgi:hypothetical protein
MGAENDIPNNGGNDPAGTPPAGNPPAGNAPPAGNPPAGNPPANAPAPGGDPWYSSVEGLDADVQKWISDKKFADVATALKSGMHADHVARDRNVLQRPAADKLAEWDGWKDLGWTEDRKAYAVTADEETRKAFPSGYNDAFEQAFVDAAHSARVPVPQAKAILSGVLDYVKASYEQAGLAGEKATADLNAALDQEWGADATKNRELSSRAARALGVGVDDMSALEKVMGSPGLVKLFHQIGSMMDEDKLRDPKTPAGNSMTAAGAKAELQRFNADAGNVAALGDATHPNHAAVKAARERLIGIIAKG